jgi:uncharacterized membrane protein
VATGLITDRIHETGVGHAGMHWQDRIEDVGLVTTLVVVAFPYATTASAAAADMLLLEPDMELDADDIALISCDDRGQFHVTTNHESIPGESRGLFWLLLFSALFFAPVSAVLSGYPEQNLERRVEAAGLSESFQVKVRELLQPDSSALFMIVSDHLPVDAVEALGRFGGQVLAAPLRAEAEAQILRAVYEQQG